MFYLEFDYFRNSNAVNNSLSDFIIMAKAIRSAKNFKKSPLGQLESLISDPKAFFMRLLKDVDIERFNFDTCFFAFAAPSLEGKTQSAFLFETIRPLYFALNQFGLADCQKIYLNFESLNMAIQKFAEIDIAMIKSQIPSLNSDDGIFKAIRVENLSIKFAESKFTVLGFLAELIKHSEKKFKSTKITGKTEENWMKFYSKISNLNEFEAMTLTEFENLKPKNKYFVFLDEFGVKNWMVLIRNLARRVGLRCVVANTNTNIANLTGKSEYSCSRVDSRSVWSIVINRLNCADWNLLNEAMNQICLQNDGKIYNYKNSKEAILKKSSNCVSFVAFFKELEAMNSLRPGFGVYLALAIRKFAEKLNSYDIKGFFDFIFRSIASEICMRKVKIGSTNGILANIGLLTPIPYVDSDDQNPDDAFRRICYLNDHLFYVINPSDNTNWLFFTFLSLSTSPKSVNLSILKNSDIVDWKHEVAFLKSDDIITTLTCLFISFKASIASIFEDSIDSLSRKPEAIVKSPNPKALSLDGNYLEIVASCCIIDSSHSGYIRNNYKQTSLSGQNGVAFFENLIGNLIKNSSIQRQFININICPVAKNFLNQIKVPFLGPYNMKLPTVLPLGKFNRTENLKKIDAIFEIEQIVSVDECKTFFSTVECKNWITKLNSPGIAKILKKSFDTVKRATDKRHEELDHIDVDVDMEEAEIDNSYEGEEEEEEDDWEEEDDGEEDEDWDEEDEEEEEDDDDNDGDDDSDDEKEIINTELRVMNLIFCNSLVKPKEKIDSSLWLYCLEKRIQVFKIQKTQNQFNLVNYYKKLKIKAPKRFCFILEMDLINR